MVAVPDSGHHFVPRQKRTMVFPAISKAIDVTARFAPVSVEVLVADVVRMILNWPSYNPSLMAKATFPVFEISVVVCVTAIVPDPANDCGVPPKASGDAVRIGDGILANKVARVICKSTPVRTKYALSVASTVVATSKSVSFPFAIRYTGLRTRS